MLFFKLLWTHYYSKSIFERVSNLGTLYVAVFVAFYNNKTVPYDTHTMHCFFNSILSRNQRAYHKLFISKMNLISPGKFGKQRAHTLRFIVYHPKHHQSWVKLSKCKGKVKLDHRASDGQNNIYTKKQNIFRKFSSNFH